MVGKQRTIVITGVAGAWGSRLARRLVDESGLHILGIDKEAPRDELKQVDFVQADVRSPLLAELLHAEGVDTVCHMAFVSALRHSERLFDSNVLGTMKLLGACAEAGVRRVIVKSSTEVYGAHADNPAFLTEAAPLRAQSRRARVRHLLEIEGFLTNFQRQEADVSVTVLRFANIVGPTVFSPMSDLLNQHVVPTLLGFDPLMQLVHEDDVVDALAFSALNELPGVFNVAGEGVYPLAGILRLARCQPLPVAHPLGYWAQRVPLGGRLNVIRSAPFEPDYLRYRWVADLARMRTVMGFTPRLTGEEALIDMVEQRRLRPFLSPREAWQQTEDRLREVIAARRQEEATR